jgi:hypothetical protein
MGRKVNPLRKAKTGLLSWNNFLECVSELSHARMRLGSNPGLPRATSRLFTQAPGRVAHWASWWFSLHELHVYSSIGSKAEA